MSGKNRDRAESRRCGALAGTLALAVAGCGSAPPLTTGEWALLRQQALTQLPPSPTNRYADDLQVAALGQRFYGDPRFSGPLSIGDDGSNGGLGAVGQPGRVACASCHALTGGGVDHRSRPGNTSLGAGYTGRNAPTVYNAAYNAWQFWDGRKDSLWSQALGPIESGVEHNFSRLEVAHLIAQCYAPDYQASFGALPNLSDLTAFPPRGKPGDPAWAAMAPSDQDAVNRVFANFGKAIEAFERKILDRNSPFDRFVGGDASALNDAQLRGARLFVGRASCNECHRGPLFSDGKFHNTGVPQVGFAVRALDRGRADGVVSVLGDPFNGAGPYSDDPAAGGAKLATLVASDRDMGAFKTPTLRGVARTAPYMHTGAFASLYDVVRFYRQGGGTDGFVGTVDPAIQPLRLSDADVEDLVAFLESLSGEPLPAALTGAGQ